MTRDLETRTRPTSATGTVSRALQLLALLADSTGSVSVKQVADEMQLAPSTVHRLLQLLRREGFVQGAQGPRYSIGPQFYRVAARVMSLMAPSSSRNSILSGSSEFASRRLGLIFLSKAR